MQAKKALLTVNKGGSGSSTFRATLPTSWIREMKLNEDTRNIKIEFDGTRIVITNNEEEIKMLNKLMKKAKVEIEKEIEVVGFIDDSDNTDRFLDQLSRSLTEKEILKGNSDLEFYYEKEDEIEDVTEKLLEEIKDFMSKEYKSKGETDEGGDYEGCYYETKEGHKKWKEIVEINE